LAELEREVAVVASTMDLVGWLRKHLEAADTDLLREMVLGFVQALMSAEADAACGAALVSAQPSGSTSATATGIVAWTLAWAPWSWPSRSCGLAATTRTGCWGHAGEANAPWWRWWPSAMCVGCRPAGWRAWWRPWDP
jgi:hypothetical protein